MLFLFTFAKQNMKKQHLYISLILLFAFTSCKQKHFYSEFKTVNIKEWKSTDTLAYAVNIKEENKNYQTAISVRYQSEYEFSNLWLKIFIAGNGVDTSFRYEIPLFKNDGKPYGEKSGNLCTQTISINTQLPFYKIGNYNVKVVQLMRKDPLDGISDIGIVIDKK